MLLVKPVKTFGKRQPVSPVQPLTATGRWELGNQLTQRIKQARVEGDTRTIRELDLQLRRLFLN